MTVENFELNTLYICLVTGSGKTQMHSWKNNKIKKETKLEMQDMIFLSRVTMKVSLTTKVKHPQQRSRILRATTIVPRTTPEAICDVKEQDALHRPSGFPTRAFSFGNYTCRSSSRLMLTLSLNKLETDVLKNFQRCWRSRSRLPSLLNCY